MVLTYRPAPLLSVAPPSVTFPTVPLGRSNPSAVDLSNQGSGPLTVSLPVVVSGGPFAVDPGTCSAPVAPGASCRLSVRLTATTAGAFTGAARVASDGRSVTIPLAATLTPPPRVTRLSIARAPGRILRVRIGVVAASSTRTRLTLQRAVVGQRVGTACRASSRPVPARLRCVRWATVSVLTARPVATVLARVPTSGSYRVVAVAYGAAGAVSRPRVATAAIR